MTETDETELADPEALLDGLLAQWAEPRRLTPDQSQAIRQRLNQEIRPPRPELTYAWWQRLFQHCSQPFPPASQIFRPVNLAVADRR